MNVAWIRNHAGSALFLAFNVFMLLCIYMIVVQPIGTILTEQATRLSDRSGELARYQAMAGEESAVRALFGQARDERNASIFLSGENEGAASAALQARLKQVGENSGLQIRSIAALEPRTENAVRYLGAQMDVSGAIASIHQTLDSLQRGIAPVLFVKSLTIRAPASAAGDAAEQQPILNVQIEVLGAVQNVDATR